MTATRLNNLTLLVIFLLGLFLRTAKLDQFPAGLHVDEAIAGYNGFLILKDHVNIAGQTWPIYIDSFGDYRPALISYLSAPFVALFGLTNAVSRYPTAIFGSLLILLAYALSFKIYADKKAALVTAFLVAISPYGVITSRGTLEGVIDVFFTLTAVLVTLSFLKSPRLYKLAIVFLCLIFGYFSYMTSRVLAIPFGAVTILFATIALKPKKKTIILALLPFAVYLIFPWLFFINSPVGQGRFQQVGVLSAPENQMRIDESLREDGQTANHVVSRIFHNKPLTFIYDVSQRYFTYYSPALLLFEMRHPSRHYFPGVGAVLAVEIIGVLFFTTSLAFKHPRSRRLWYLPLVLLILAPIPASLTSDDFPNFSRIVFFVPLIQILAGWGLARLIKNRVFFTVLVIITVWQTSFFLHQYFVHGPAHRDSIETRATEMRSLALFLKDQTNRHKKVLLSEYDGPYIYYLFYNSLNLFDRQVKKIGPYFSVNYQIDTLDFVASPCVGQLDLIMPNHDTLVVRDGCLVPKGAKILTKLYRSDGSLAMTAFDLTNWEPYQKNALTVYNFVKKEEL